MTPTLVCDIRIWLTEAQYAGLLRRCREDERSLSAFVRRLIQRDLDESLEAHPLLNHDLRGSLAGRS